MQSFPSPVDYQDENHYEHIDFEDEAWPNLYGEVAIVTARAMVMLYDEPNKKWKPAGNLQSPGVSKVQIYHHTVNNTFRVVGRKLQDHEVVINSAILKGLRYNQATPTFHQWRDSRNVWGLNFSNQEEADNFAHSMLAALDTLNSIYRTPAPVTPAPPPPQQQPIYSQVQPTMNNGPQEQDDRLQRDDFPTHKRQMSGGAPAAMAMNNDMVPSAAPQAPPSAPPVAPAVPAAPAAPPIPPAPPAPPAPSAGGPPKAPAAPPSGGGAPPPPPPPPPGPGASSGGGGGGGGGGGMGGLAMALQNAKLKKVSSKPPEESGPVSSGGGGGGSSVGDASGSAVGTLPRPGGGGMGDMMSEMAMKLQARRKKAEKDNADPSPADSSAPPPPAAASPVPQTDRRPWEKSATPGNNGPQRPTNGSESPKTIRKRNPSLTGQEPMSTVNGGALSSEMETLKQEILSEMRREMQRMKSDIIEAVRQELGNR